MIGRLRRAWRALFGARPFSSRALCLWAVRFALAFGALHLAGLREHTAVLSGTVTGPSAAVSGFLGMAYLLTYFVALLLVPPLLVAAGIARIAEHLWRGRHH